jgi:hypothetical protein
MFTVEERERVRAHILARAASDPEVIAGAAVGSAAVGLSDRWSDLDLTFGLREGTDVVRVLEEWTHDLAGTFRAVHLFDVTERATVYRVFLLPGNLQVDLSFTPDGAAEYGPKFRLLFGTAVKRELGRHRAARDAFGYAAHHVVRARFSVERGHPWQAEYWIGRAREEILALACLRRGLDASHARGFDLLPPEVTTLAIETLVRSLGRAELLRALGGAVELLLRESGEIGEPARRLEAQLRDLTRADRS